jgi:hypothetical protein
MRHKRYKPRWQLRPHLGQCHPDLKKNRCHREVYLYHLLCNNHQIHLLLQRYHQKHHILPPTLQIPNQENPSPLRNIFWTENRNRNALREMVAWARKNKIRRLCRNPCGQKHLPAQSTCPPMGVASNDMTTTNRHESFNIILNNECA